MSDYQGMNQGGLGGTNQGAGTTASTGDNGGATAGAAGADGGAATDASAGMMGRVQEGMNQAREMVSGGMDQMTDAMGRVGQSVQDQLDRVRSMNRDDLDVMFDDVMEAARRNPGRTILISAGVGLALGMMMRGDRGRAASGWLARAGGMVGSELGPMAGMAGTMLGGRRNQGGQDR